MKQLTFILMVVFSTIFVELNSPLLFLTSFILGVAINVLMKWKLPRHIKKEHSW